jgi:hypothetical protein
VKDLNDLQAIHKDLPKHIAVLAQILLTTEMKDRGDVLDWDKLSTSGQDDLFQLVFVAEGTLVELESENRFVR